MSPPKAAVTVAEIYDQANHYARDQRLPPEAPRPLPTQHWPPGCLELLERYRDWLEKGGTSVLTTRIYHIPMAGHVLGLALKPPEALDLETDLQPALDFIHAKQLSPAWNKNCRCSLVKFQRYLRFQRGLGEIRRPVASFEPHTQGLPNWLVTEIENLQRLRQRNWRPARLEGSIQRFWSGHLRLWRFLVERCGVVELGDLRRQHVFDFLAHQQDAGLSVSTINSDLRDLRALLIFMQEQGYSLAQSLLRIPDVKPPDRLPRFLTDEQVSALRGEIERSTQACVSKHTRRDALLTRAAFYLLWQSGLRLGEVEELRLEDLDLPNRKLLVRESKLLKDRTVFLTDTTVRALQDYLAVRGEGSSDHVFLYRQRALCKDLVSARIKAAGRQAGVKVHPHRLRHTCATQLLNAGCKITSIQKFLGHKKISSTMIYARVHDQTVSDDYYAAMERVEQRLALVGGPAELPEPVGENEREQLRSLAEQLFVPELTLEKRLEIAAQMRSLLGEASPEEWIPPPTSVLANVEIN